jgi:hypothetical protein
VPTFADRTRETSTTTGTGAFTLAGAVTAYQSFATALGAGGAQRVQYAIINGTEWEIGVGSFNGTTTLTRDTVRSSSNAGALVSFSAGTKDVFVTASSEIVDNANNGYQTAQAGMWFPPF